MFQYLPEDDGTIADHCIRRLSDGAVIPFDEENYDYILYKRWLDEGNTPLSVDVPYSQPVIDTATNSPPNPTLQEEEGPDSNPDPPATI